jgi:hypothetical protein
VSFDYADAPFSGTFLAYLTRPGLSSNYCHPVEAENLAHLDALLTDYCYRNGFVVQTVTFADRTVPGFGGVR